MQSVLKRNDTRTITPSIDQYNQMNAWGLYSSVDIYKCAPEIIRDEEMIRQYVIQLCDLLKMNRYGEAKVVNFGKNEDVAGYSMTQLIETSLISGHFANKTDTAYIDIFSCEYYDPEVVAHFSFSYFKGRNYILNVTLRK